MIPDMTTVDILFSYTTPPTEQAVSALKVATAAVSRTEQLLNEHLATRQQLTDDQKSESDARAALAALQTQGAGGPTTLP